MIAFAAFTIGGRQHRRLASGRGDALQTCRGEVGCKDDGAVGSPCRAPGPASVDPADLHWRAAGKRHSRQSAETIEEPHRLCVR